MTGSEQIHFAFFNTKHDIDISRSPSRDHEMPLLKKRGKIEHVVYDRGELTDSSGQPTDDVFEAGVLFFTHGGHCGSEQSALLKVANFMWHNDGLQQH